MESINNGKATIKNSVDEFQISIPAEKDWGMIVFMIPWLGGWFFGIWNSLEMFGVDGFETFWLIGWTIAGLFILTAVLWSSFGIETFTIKGHQVFFNTTIFGIGVKTVLDKSVIENIRFNSNETNYSETKKNKSKENGKIEFDYGFKTYSFGSGLHDLEAKYLVEILKDKLS